MTSDNASDRGESRLLTQLREINTALVQAGIRFALIGGAAVNAHGYVRATHDLDILVLVEAADALHEIICNLGYQALDRRPDISSYVRAPLRLDVLHAQRPISRDLLMRAISANFRDMSVPVISVEGLIGLKIQAFDDDPRRFRDLDDMMQLLKINRRSLNLEEVRAYFHLFQREALLDDILRAID